MKDHLFYVAKFSTTRFKFGITKNVKNRMNNLITTGYGRAKLIGESTIYCTHNEALDLEWEIKRKCEEEGIYNEYCDINQVEKVISIIRKIYGFQYHNPINVRINNDKKLELNETLVLNLTPGVISETTDKCTSSTSQCVLAIAALRQGFARPDFQVNQGKFSRNGKRYTCLLSKEASQTLLQFDEDKTKLTPRSVKVEIVKVEDIKTKEYKPRYVCNVGKTKKKEPAIPRRTRGRDKGIVKYFLETK